MQTLKLMKRLRLGKSALRLPFFFSIGLTLSCQSAPPFPTNQLIEYDAKFKVCGLYRITDPANLQFVYVKDIPCPSVFGFNSKDIPKVLDWAQEMQVYVQQHCR